MKIAKDLIGTFAGQIFYYITLLYAAYVIEPVEYSEFAKFIFNIGFLTLFCHLRLDWLLPQSKDYENDYIKYKKLTTLSCMLIFLIIVITGLDWVYIGAVYLFARNELAISYHIKAGDYHKLSYIKTIQFCIFFISFIISSKSVNALIYSYTIGLLTASIIYEFYSPKNKVNLLDTIKNFKNIDVNVIAISLISRGALPFLILIFENKLNSYELGVFSFIILTHSTPVGVINASFSRALWSEIVNNSPNIYKQYFKTFKIMSLLYLIISIAYILFFDILIYVVGDDWEVSVKKLLLIVFSLYPSVVGSSLNQYLGLGHYKLQYVGEVLRVLGFSLFFFFDHINAEYFYVLLFLVNFTVLIVNLLLHRHIILNKQSVNQ